MSVDQAPSSVASNKDLILDLGERLCVLVLFAIFVNRMLPQFWQLVHAQLAYPELIFALAGLNAQALLLILSEGLDVLLIIIRRRSPSLSSHPLDWALCFLAVSLPLMISRAPAGNLIPAEMATAMMMIGLVLQIAAKVALWRSFGYVPANRGIKVGGPYRILRHPMYAGYIITHVGFLLGFPLNQNAALYAAAFAIQVARIIREEKLLSQDAAYKNYVARVRYRLLPGVF